jgi:hypothetical protein
MVFRSLANGRGIATVGYESLRTALLCAPGSQKAALATVSRAVLCLRLTAWIDQIGYRRNPRTGFSLGGSYTVRSEPLRDAAAYLFGLIRKALQGTFRLWAARKNAQERPASRIQEAPLETLKSASPSGAPVAEPADPPASREVASAYLQHMKALLQGSANTVPMIHTTKPPERRHPSAPLVHALAQAMPAAGPLRPVAAFLTPVMETGR